MKEPALNGLLAVQVAISLVLTGLLLFGPGVAQLQAERPTVHPAVSAEQPVPDLVRPRLIWAHLGDGNYTGYGHADILYDVMWQQLRAPLARSLSRPSDYSVAASRDVLAAAAQPLVGIELEFPLPAAEWSRLLGYPRPAPGAESDVDRVVFALGEPARVYLLGPRVIARSGALSDWDRRQLLRLLQRVSGAPGAVYRPLSSAEQVAITLNPLAPATGHAVGSQGGVPARLTAGLMVDPWVLAPEPPEVAVPNYEPRPVDPEVLVPRFFPDITVVREVEEQDATVFIGGQRALRVYPYGGIEFWDFGERPVPAGPPLSPADALRIAADFMSRRSLWLPGVTLSGYRTGPDGVTLGFRYHHDGMPWESRQRLLEIRVLGERVTYLYQSPDYTQTDSPELEPVVPARTAVAFVAAAVQGPDLRVRAVYLAHRVYRSRGAQTAIPVWVVRLSNGETALIDARTGNFRW